MSKKINSHNIYNTYTVSFWRRAASFLTDLLIINIVIISQFNIALRNYVDGITLNRIMAEQISVPTGLYMMLLIISLLALLYFTFFEYYLGQTIGDMLFKIKTISLKESDGKINIWTAAIRNCYIIPFFPFYILWAIEPLYLTFYKERFLEKITGTKTMMTSINDWKKSKSKTYKLEKV